MKVAVREWEAVLGGTVRVPDPERLVHLQFRRFAGCPVCNLHLRSIMARRGEITAHGIVEVVVFHSSHAELRPHVADFPFAVIGDPEKRLYVESAARAVLDPRAWGAILRGLARDLGSVLRGHRPLPEPEGGRLGLPADFLIAPNGLVVAEKRGQHAFDQWSVEELLAHAQALASKG